MNVTALTVSRAPARPAPAGLPSRCLHGRQFRRAADVQSAWFDAIDLVDTSHFFFIDDDDALPAGHGYVLDLCVEAGKAIAYTDELVNGQRRVRQDYSQQDHLADPTLVHHLVVCDTSIARDAIKVLPRGNYWPEMLLYWEMAKRGGAAYIPEVGYVWNKRSTGLHCEWFTILGMSNSRSWCAQQRTMEVAR